MNACDADYGIRKFMIFKKIFAIWTVIPCPTLFKYIYANNEEVSTILHLPIGAYLFCHAQCIGLYKAFEIPLNMH